MRPDRIEYAAGGGPDKRCYRVDFSHLHTTFPDFKINWSARRGAEEIYEALRQTPVSVEDFEGQKYARIAHIRDLLDKERLDRSLRWRV